MNSLNNSKCSLIDLLQNKWFSEVSITIIIHRQAKWLFWLWCLSQGERESSLVLLWRGCYISATMCESICDLPVLTTTLYLWSYVCDCLLPCCFCLQPPKFFFFTLTTSSMRFMRDLLHPLADMVWHISSKFWHTMKVKADLDLAQLGHFYSLAVFRFVRTWKTNWAVSQRLLKLPPLSKKLCAFFCLCC